MAYKTQELEQILHIHALNKKKVKREYPFDICQTNKHQIQLVFRTRSDHCAPTHTHTHSYAPTLRIYRGSTGSVFAKFYAMQLYEIKESRYCYSSRSS